MVGVQKSSWGLKTQAFRQKYDRFTLREKQTEKGVVPFDFVANFDVSDGSGRVGVGAETFQLLGDVSTSWNWSSYSPKAFFHCGGKIGFLSAGHRAYLYNEGSKSFALERYFGVENAVVSAQDAAGDYHVYFCGEKGVFVYDEMKGMVEVLEGEYLPVACAFQGRIFTARADELVYSAPFDVGDFSESIDGGGSIVLPSDTGKIVAFAAVSSALYVFCEYGIWKLTAAGSARDFRLEKVGYTHGKILGGSACAAACSGGEKVFFFTENGICKLENSSVEKICENLAFSVKSEGQVCKYAYLDGKVIYAYQTPTGTVESLVIDAETEKGYPCFAAQGVSNVQGQTIAVVDGVLCLLKTDLPLPASRIAEAAIEKFDFQISGVKTLRSLRVFGEGKITVSVGNGRRTKTFDLQTENGIAKADVKLRGEYFRLRFLLGENAVLRGLEADVSKLLGVQ